MKTSLMLKKLHLEGKEFVTSDDLKKHSKAVGADYATMIKNLERRKFLTRIFRGIFYVRTTGEIYDGKSRYNRLELVARGLEIKGIKNWYFGLYTALKLNNMTHEYFTIDDVVSDSIFRQKPMSIGGHKFNFVKISESLLDFGIVKTGMIRHSDPEKTILDFAYMWKFNGKSDGRITMDVSEWSDNISKNKLRKYSKNYPKSVQKIAGEINP